MLNILKKIWKFLFKKITLHIGAVLLAINIVILGAIGYLTYNNVLALKHIEKYIDIQTFGHQKQIEDIYDFLKILTENIIITDTIEAELLIKIIDNMGILKNSQIEIENKIKEVKTIDLENIENIKKANLIIINETTDCMGAGTHIKYDNKNYVLSCAHLINEPTDLIIAIENKNNEEILLELVHYDKDYDLSLFRMTKCVKHIPALEISEEFPEVGSEVIVIGNPDMFEDLVTDGAISKIKNKIYIMTNKVYCGNSGGAVLYKGKIVGVLSAMQIMFNFPQIENFAIAINLKTIHRFLEDCNLK